MGQQRRQPKGVPVGGQFSTTTHGEPDVTLAGGPVADPESQYGLSLIEDGVRIDWDEVTSPRPDGRGFSVQTATSGR